MAGWLHIDWTWMMTAQERKDFRRVQKSREVWKRRAVRRGEDRRRLRERHKEVDSSREAWRERALAAEHRTRQLEIETHQLKSALAQASRPTPIDTPPFFSAISFSLSC
jgi:hypothetical protein